MAAPSENLKAALAATPLDQVFDTVCSYLKTLPQFKSPVAQGVIGLIQSTGDFLLQHFGI